MSVNEEKSPSVETSQQIEFLRKELCSSLTKQLKSQTDEAERERLESLIGDIHAEIEKLKITADEPTTTTLSQTQEIFTREKVNPKNAGTEATRDLSKGE